MHFDIGRSSTLLRLGRAIITCRTVRVVALVGAVTLSLWNVDRVPHTTLLPAVVGLLPFAIGKYVLCPLRWHALSTSGQTRRWHLRAYAESEILGIISPWHMRRRSLAGAPSGNRWRTALGRLSRKSPWTASSARSG